MDALSLANSKIKKGVADALRVSQDDFPFFVDLKIHDIHFRFFVKEEDVIAQLYRMYPVNWFTECAENAIQVYWFNNKDFGFSDEQWESSPSYECLILPAQDKTYAIQRDFLGIQEHQKMTLVTSYEVGDGFYNFLRWAMPLHFIRSRKYLLHSSCILDPYKRAYFCLGPSGAGKTTISSLAPRKRVLGDDMNVLKIENGKCWAQAGALGQAITNPEEYSAWYPVEGIYWLEKAPSVEVHTLSKADQYLKLSSSVANVFWPQLSSVEIQMIMSGITEILSRVELKKLMFPIDKDVWPTLWSSELKNQKTEVPCAL